MKFPALLLGVLLALTAPLAAEELTERIDAYTMLVEQGREEAGRTILLETLAEAAANPAKFHNNPGDQHQLARAALRLEELPLALQYNTRALELQAENPAFHGMRGFLLVRMDALPEARAAYMRSIELGSESWHDHYELAVLLLTDGQAREALPLLEKAAVLKDDFADTFAQMGSARHLLQDFAGALEAFERALLLSPESASAAYNAGQVAQLLGEHHKARKYFETVIEKHPDDVQSMAKLVQTCEALEDFPCSNQWVEKLVAIYRAGESALLNRQQFFIRDQFSVSGKWVMAVHYFDYTRDGITDVKYSFNVLEAPNGPKLYRLTYGRNETTTQVSRELGTIGPEEHLQILDGFYDWGHATHFIDKTELTYHSVKELVRNVVAEESAPLSSSTQNQTEPGL